VSVGTRILVLEDDGPPVTFSSLPDPSVLTMDEQDLKQAAMQQLRALIARIADLLGLGSSTSSAAAPVAEMRFGALTVDARSRAIVRAGQRIALSRKEFDLLYALIRRGGAIATRKDLVREVWGPVTQVHHRAVDTHIARLRRKVEDSPARPRYILTAVALGYRFAATPEVAGTGKLP
jgi:DNA-binding response OmpR family regulator